MANLLISGSSGFIGHHLVLECVKQGHQVFVTGKDEENGWCPECVHLGSKFYRLPWKRLPKIDCLFHLAGCTDTMITDHRYMLKVNYEWAVRLFEAAYEHGVSNIVYSSSAAVYGKQQGDAFLEDDKLKPLNIYGESKARLDRYAMNWMKERSCPIVGLRYSNVYGGPSEEHKKRTASMVWQIFKKIKSGEMPTLFKYGEQARDFVHVNDVVQANLLAWKYNKSGIFNIGAGNMWSFNKIVELVNHVLGMHIGVNYIDNWLQEYYQDYNAIVIERARSELGYDPKYNLLDGIREIHALNH